MIVVPDLLDHTLGGGVRGFGLVLEIEVKMVVAVASFWVVVVG